MIKSFISGYLPVDDLHAPLEDEDGCSGGSCKERVKGSPPTCRLHTDCLHHRRISTEKQLQKRKNTISTSHQVFS